MPERLALYTTVYPGVEQYLAAWYRSVEAQTDKDFDVCIGVDSLDAAHVISSLGAESHDVRLILTKGETPAKIRQDAMELLVREYPAVVFVDSDDLLQPSRVQAAREGLEYYGLVGCALRVIDEQGRDLGVVFGPAAGQDLNNILPRQNVFGLSNTAYRSEELRRCLPLPADCELVDWLLATRVWLGGCNLHFDRTPRMNYRQYPANVAPVLLPFSPCQVLDATAKVLKHYSCVLAGDWQLPLAQRSIFEAALERVARFQQTVAISAETLEGYVRALNQLPPQYVWWWCVANSDLEDIWKN